VGRADGFQGEGIRDAVEFGIVRAKGQVGPEKDIQGLGRIPFDRGLEQGGMVVQVEDRGTGKIDQGVVFVPEVQAQVPGARVIHIAPADPACE